MTPFVQCRVLVVRFGRTTARSASISCMVRRALPQKIYLASVRSLVFEQSWAIPKEVSENFSLLSATSPMPIIRYVQSAGIVRHPVRICARQTQKQLQSGLVIVQATTEEVLGKLVPTCYDVDHLGGIEARDTIFLCCLSVEELVDKHTRKLALNAGIHFHMVIS